MMFVVLMLLYTTSVMDSSWSGSGGGDAKDLKWK